MSGTTGVDSSIPVVSVPGKSSASVTVAQPHRPSDSKWGEQDPLTRLIIGGAIEVHKVLGPGLLESVYEECLAVELADRGLAVQRQVPVPVLYKGRKLDCAYRCDMIINDLVIIEIKAVDKLLPVHEAQLLSYLRLMNKRVGLLFNFHTPYLRDSIVRRVL